ncbi:hypothetical protein E2562_030246 [Oryza meyeriana var. granulata]|uniref:Uncharacterized protein n=1 Tax=Oryza meyeriana var. granulata TaxID=110450 RepID=A0A6G1D994_9ORYZ|nr:hypothetical protein E2562_030246 [Oryza meyeriana var. granulata]
MLIAQQKVMDTNLCSKEEQQDQVVSDEDDDFVVEEVQSDSSGQVTDKARLLEPMKGMLFDSEDSATCFYKSYARKMGFGVIKRGSKKTDDGKVKYFTLACSR